MSQPNKQIEYDGEPIKDFRRAIVDNNDLEFAEALLKTDAGKIKAAEGVNLLNHVCRYCSRPAVELLLRYGWDVNGQDSNNTTALGCAISSEQFAVAKCLLKNGADPNLQCPFFDVAMFVEEDSVRYAKLLVEHGADVNQPFFVEGMPVRNGLSQAIESGDDELADYLRSQGARLPNRDDEKQQPIAKKVKTADYTDQVVAHFKKHYGPVRDGALVELVPSYSVPVAIHHIPKVKDLPECSIYFTTGLSRHSLAVPKGQENFQLAELFVYVLGNWPDPQQASTSLEHQWVIQWLQKLAAYPVENETWLGGPVTILSETEPPTPLSENNPFTAWMLASPNEPEHRCKVASRKKVALYQLFPLFAGEYELERQQGLSALMDAINQNGMPEWVEPQRPDVSTQP